MYNVKMLFCYIIALTMCMENPEISGRIQMERFMKVEIFWKK